MPKTIYKMILTLNSLIVFLVVYGVKIHLRIPVIEGYTIIIYICVPILFSGICLKLSDFLSHDSIEKISNIEVGAESYMAVYLGYFFVATGIPDNDWITLLFVFGTLFLFLFFSQAQYFNPLFLLFGYKFYGITKYGGMKIFVISKRNIHGIDGLKFSNLRRINNFTFIDKER